MDDTAEARDRLILRDYVREAEVGAFQDERGRGQRLRFAVTAEVAPAPDAVVADDVDGILSYDHLLRAVDAAFDGPRPDLLETVAERVAQGVLAHAQTRAVRVRVEKLDRGPFVLGVEIRRQGGAGAMRQEAVHPRVAVLRADGMASDALGAQLDRLHADPPVLIVPAADAPVPEAEHPSAQRRIALLTLEQAAWRLAARDHRCLVVDSLTELDHALRTRRLTVWAPGRVVLNATHQPEGVDPDTLAAWIADRLGGTVA